MGSIEDWYWALGNSDPNYLASGFCQVGYATVWPVNTFNVGGGFNGRDFGILASCGPVGLQPVAALDRLR
jgi:hypothetical protein